MKLPSVKFSNTGLMNWAGLSFVGGTMAQMPFGTARRGDLYDSAVTHKCKHCGCGARLETMRHSVDGGKTFHVRSILRCLRVADTNNWVPACKPQEVGPR